MAVISREEVLKLARISQIKLAEDEIDYMVQQLEARLSYVTILKSILEQHKTADNAEGQVQTLVNIMREDVVKSTDSEPLLQEAPQREGNYFVVPVIIKQKPVSAE